MSAQLIAAQADLNFLHSDSVQLTDPMTPCKPTAL
jgi:hypothetical protein